jgi:hypothetical protein
MMANSLDQDLTGKVVLIRKDVLKPEWHYDRRFLVKGGFGALPHTMGKALMGTFLVDGESCRMSGWDVESVVEDDDAERQDR